jgi:membrane associated rhomboid family serine protease
VLPLANPLKSQSKPYFTYVIIVMNFLVFAAENFAYQQMLNNYAVIPRQLTTHVFSAETVLDMFRSLFIHASIVHLLLNMLYLWIFGEMVENWLGRGWYAGLLLLSGTAATVLQVLFDTNSTLPIFGSSGAVAGVMGAYLVLYPNTRIKCITPNSVMTGKLSDIPAMGVVALWFLIQLLAGILSLDMGSGEGGVAFFAHILGVIVGVTFVRQRMKRSYGKSYNFPAPTSPTNYGKIIPQRRSSSPRSPDRPAYNWKATDSNSGKALQKVESTLKDLKEQANHKLATEEKAPKEKPALDLSYLPSSARKREAIRYLSTRHGSTVSLQTENKSLHQGKIVRMTGTQVVLEDEQNTARWILFTEITQIF